jgi:hypothetical protein
VIRPAERHGGRLSILTRLQLGLEALYRVETRLDVEAFVIDEQQREAQREQSGVARAPREQLLVRESDEELSMALFVDAKALENLEVHDPASGLHAANFADFCVALEGVSHFVYLALCAAGERRVSALELELQAEVDKFACCVLLDPDADDLRRRLFRDVRFAEDLEPHERERYQTANDEANRYAGALERQYVAEDRLGDMLADLRRFYRLSLRDKLAHIARAAG